MLKRSMVLVMVLVLVVSFSVVALAEKAPKNNSGVEIHVEIEGEDGEYITIGDALGNDNAKENNPNPIRVAGN